MTKPYLRPAPPEGAPPFACPDGQVAEPAGIWHGRWMEVVYDPTRHDVALLREGVSAGVEEGLRGTGWEKRLTDGPNQMWIRDRIALAQRRLEHVRSSPQVPRIA